MNPRTTPRKPSKERAARASAQYAMRTGRLVRQPCEVCGTSEGRIEAHHDDYDKPLNVRWLCKRHHIEIHAELIRATRVRGEQSGQAKLTDAQVSEIRRRHRVIHPSRKTGSSSTELAHEFGITRQYVGQLVGGKWRVAA